MRRPWSTAAIWIATLLCLTICGAMVAEILLIPVSLDPSETIGAGAAPWSDALTATGAFVAMVVAGLLGLGLWHTARLRGLGAILTLLEIGATLWACRWFAREYL